MNAISFSKITLGALTVAALGLAIPASAENSPRDAASGMPTGKRMHSPASPTCVEGEACDASEVSSPRDAASGQATGKRMHKPMTVRSESDAGVQDHNSSRSNKSASLQDGPDDDGDGRAEGVKSPRDASSGLATGKRMHKPMAAPDLDSDNDAVSGDAQGKSISEQGVSSTKSRNKNGSAK